MKRLTAILCCLSLAVLSIAAGRESSAGVYVQHAGIYAIELTLLPDGSYIARWDNDLPPPVGTAFGSWVLVGSEVRLSPKEETGFLKGHLRVLFVREFEGKKALLRKEDISGEKYAMAYFFLNPESSVSAEPETGLLLVRPAGRVC